MSAIEAVGAEVTTAALCRSLDVSRASLYRHREGEAPQEPKPPRAKHPRALDPVERQAVLDKLHSERFVDQSPAEVHATLLEEKTYLCSPRTMYRLLAQADEVRERRNQLRHPHYQKPELVATAPNQVSAIQTEGGREGPWGQLVGDGYPPRRVARLEASGGEASGRPSARALRTRSGLRAARARQQAARVAHADQLPTTARRAAYGAGGSHASALRVAERRAEWLVS